MCPVVQVGSVAHGRHHEDGYEYEEYPSGRLRVFAQKSHQVGIIEVVALEERNGGLCGLDFLCRVHHFHLSVRLFHLDVFADDHLRAEVEGQSYNQSQTYLADNLELAVQPLLVPLEYLDIVVGKAQRPQPYRRDEHQYHIDVAQASQQQAGEQCGKDDDDSSHTGYAHFLHAEGVDGSVALRLGNLFPLQQPDEAVAPYRRDEQRQDDGHQCPERRVGEHTCAGEIVLVKPTE